jgi:hypothetical protein
MDYFENVNIGGNYLRLGPTSVESERTSLAAGSFNTKDT